MIGKVRYGNTVIQYSIIKSKRRKTSEIQIDKNGVVIRTPHHKPTSEIRKIVQAKKQWIFKKQLEFNTISQQKISNKKYSEHFLKRRVQFYATKIGVQPKKIIIKKLKSRWGSSTKKDTINFNKNLLNAPKDVIEYVIVHELCHLMIKNHSFRFWSLLGRFIPLYRKQKLWLEMHGSKIL